MNNYGFNQYFKNYIKLKYTALLVINLKRFFLKLKFQNTLISFNK